MAGITALTMTHAGLYNFSYLCNKIKHDSGDRSRRRSFNVLRKRVVLSHVSFFFFNLIPVTMRLLHATGGRRALPGRLRRELLTGGFTSRRFTGRLLGTRHDSTCDNKALTKY